jgi:hypothetical protein
MIFERNGVGLIFFNKCLHTVKHPNILLDRHFHHKFGFPVKNMIFKDTSVGPYLVLTRCIMNFNMKFKKMYIKDIQGYFSSNYLVVLMVRHERGQVVICTHPELQLYTE